MGMRGMSCLAYREGNLGQDMYKISLRSIDNEDTTIISKQFGGGGHLNASGFNIPKVDFEKWLIEQ